MKIVKCSNCNRLIHADKFCFFCGSTKENVTISETTVHENARSAWEKAKALVAERRFDEAQQALGEVMKWSPNSSEVHWLRLLARSKCKSDSELFFGGSCVTESPDYITALRYADDNEKSVYSAVGNSCDALKKTLLDMIKSRNYMRIEQLKLPETLQQIQQFISDRRNALFPAWQELRKCEQEIKLLENEGLYFIHECKRNMQDVRSAATQIREGLEDTSELDRKQFFTFQAQLEGLKNAADTAKEEYYRLKSSHPSVASFAKLSERRDELNKQINSVLDEIKAYEKKVEATIAQINSEQEQGSKLLEMADAGNYEQLKTVLGQKNFERAMQYALSLK